MATNYIKEANKTYDAIRRVVDRYANQAYYAGAVMAAGGRDALTRAVQSAVSPPGTSGMHALQSLQTTLSRVPQGMSNLAAKLDQLAREIITQLS